MIRQFNQRRIPVLLAVAFSGTVSASGFQLLEQNASGLGNAFAGSAANPENASIIFFNPAGMAHLQGIQVSGGVTAINVSAKFSNGNTTRPSLITAANMGGEGGDAGGWGFVPNTYLSVPINAQWTAGLGINAPFGMKTDYDSNWMGRFHAVKSDLKTVNINPSLAFKVNDAVSLGFGLNWQRLDATLTSAADTSALVCSRLQGVFMAPPFSLPAGPALAATGARCAAGAPPRLANYESQVELKGNDSSWGYNLGAMFKLSEATRFGISYRSAIKYRVRGDANIQNPPIPATAGGLVPAAAAATAANRIVAAGLYNGRISLDVKLPDTLVISGTHKLNDRWELLGDVSWTGWSKIPRLTAIRTDGALAGTVLSNTEESWRDTWRVALGANYQYNDAWKLRLGVAYDQSPVDKNDYRTPRLPDNNRYWLSFGAQFKPSKQGAIDMGYTHLFVPDSHISNNGQGLDTASKGLIDGNYKNYVNIYSISYSHAF